MATEKKIFTAEPMNETLLKAMELPPIKPLIEPWWNEGETCFFFGATGVGKTIYAMQIAFELSEHYKVLYFDFEMSDRQLFNRYQKEGIPVEFPANLIRVEMNRDIYARTEEIIKALEEEVVKHSAKVVIVDNITWLLDDTTDPQKAIKFMKEISRLKTRGNISLLILAHTPKRKATTSKTSKGMESYDNPIELNDMAGSAALSNFIDSCFAIGKSRKEENIRYLKQLKSRSSAILYGQENVVICRIVKKESGMLSLEFINKENEHKHLITDTTGMDSGNRNYSIIEYKETHPDASLREIGTHFKISHTHASRILKNKGETKK